MCMRRQRQSRLRRDEAQCHDRAAMSTPESDALASNPPRVIVLDDCPDTLSVMGRLLSMMGIDGVPAATCEAARYAATLVRDPDLVIADAALIDGDGVACAAELRARYGCATLILSGSPA